MSKNFKQAMADQKDMIAQQAKYAKRVRDLAKSLGVEKYFNAVVAAEPEAELWLGTYSITISIPVKSMKHMLEAIEAAELVFGIEFDQTEDYAASGERNFTSSKLWGLTIKARVPLETTDGQTCRRVQTGTEVKEVPTYALECSD